MVSKIREISWAFTKKRQRTQIGQKGVYAAVGGGTSGRETHQDFIEIGRYVRKQFAQIRNPMTEHYGHIALRQRFVEMGIRRRSKVDVMYRVPSLTNQLMKNVSQTEYVVVRVTDLVVEVDPYIPVRPVFE